MEKAIQFPGCLVDGDSIRWNLPDGARARLGRDYVNSMVLSPNGKYLSVAGEVGVWFYDFSMQSPIAMWNKGQSPYSALAFSYDGQLISIADSNGIVRVFDIFYGVCLAEFDCGSDRLISELSFSFNDQCLAASSTRYGESDKFDIDVWQIPKSGRETDSFLRFKSDFTYEGTSPFAFSPDNRLLACATRRRARCISPIEEGSISVWDVETRERVTCFTGLPESVGSISFSPCGRYLAAGDWTGTVHVWEVSNERLYQTYPSYGKYYMLVSYSPSGTLYAAGISGDSSDSNTLIIWDLEQAKTCYTSKEYSRYFPAEFSDGERVTFGSQVDFQVYTLSTAEHKKVLHLHRAQTSDDLVFSPDQEKLLCTGNQNVFLWTVANPQQPPEIFNPCIETTNKSLSDTFCLSAGVLSDGKYFTIAASQNTLGLLEVGNSTPIVTFTTLSEPIIAAFSPTEKLLACKDEDAQIYIWDVQNGQQRETYQAKYPEAQRMIFSPNGKYLVSGADLLYDVAQREKIDAFDLENMSIHLFSYDSTQFFCDTREAIELWDIHQCEKVLSIPKPDVWHNSNSVTLALSPCSKYLVGSCDEAHGELYLWTIGDGNLVNVFKENASIQIVSCTFSPDSTILASGGDDGTILLWDLKPYLTNR